MRGARSYLEAPDGFQGGIWGGGEVGAEECLTLSNLTDRELFLYEKFSSVTEQNRTSQTEDFCFISSGGQEAHSEPV